MASGRRMAGSISRGSPSSPQAPIRAAGSLAMRARSQRLGGCCAEANCRRRLPTSLLVATDAFGFADEDVQQALAPMVDRLAALIGSRQDVTMAPQGLSVWQRAQRVLQSSESWKTFEPWLDTCNPAHGIQRGAGTRVAGSMLSDAERSARVIDADRGAGAAAVSAAAGDHPVPADHAVPGPAARGCPTACWRHCGIGSVA